MRPTFFINRVFDEATRITVETLSNQSYRVVTSFDLQNAAASHELCTCPHHGTDKCTCQYLVLLAYPCNQGKPLVIAVHGRGQKSYVSLLEGQENEWLAALLPLVTKEGAINYLNENVVLVKKESNMSSKTFTVPTIHCNHCTHTIKMELNDIPGVKRVDADSVSKKVTVEWDSPATWEKIESTLVEFNYPPAG
jgi:copper chaperone CopZ